MENEEEIDKPVEECTPVMCEPLPFEYDPYNDQIQHIIDQVAEFCGVEFTEVPECPVEDETPEDAAPAMPDEPDPEPVHDECKEKREAALKEYHAERKDYWAKLWQIIRFISNITCWTDGPLDTFLVQMRKQTYNAEQVCACRPNCCGCDPDQIVIPLEYNPVACNCPFISGWITVMVNGKPVREEISHKYLADHFDYSTGKLYIMRDDFPDTLLYHGRCCCLCRRKLTINLMYNAGYKDILPGLLPLICPLMDKLEDAQMSVSECHNAMEQVAGYLKFKKVGNIQYGWSEADNNSQKTLALITDLYDIATLSEVMSISRCMLEEMPEEMGDVI